MGSVLQPWVMDLPLKMQSVLMTSTRGPDNHRYANVKVMNRWIRSKLFLDADPANPFIIKSDDPTVTDPAFLAGFQAELEYTTVHYFSHMLHALEIIAYKHPTRSTSRCAYVIYVFTCDMLHLPPEQREQLDVRLWSPAEGVVHS